MAKNITALTIRLRDQATEGVERLRKTLDKSRKTSSEYRGELDKQGASVNKLNGQIQQLRRLRNATDDPDKIKQYNRELRETIEARNRLQRLGDDDSLAPPVSGWQAMPSAISGSIGPLNRVAGLLTPINLTVGAIGTGMLSLGAHAKRTAGEIDRLNLRLQQQGLATQENGAQLSAMIAATSKQLGVSTDDLIRSQRVLERQMKLGPLEAQRLIQEAVIATGADYQEIQTQIEEYLPKLKEFGFSARESIGLMVQFQREGFWNDKGIDAIKEFGTSVTEQTKATTEAFTNAFGQAFTQELFQSVRTGETTIIQALKRVGQEIEARELDQQQYAQLIADTFRAAGEDGGKAAIKLATSWTNSVGQIIDENDKLVQRTQVQLETTYQLQRAYASLGEAMRPVSDASDQLLLDLTQSLTKFGFSLQGGDREYEYFKSLTPEQRRQQYGQPTDDPGTQISREIFGGQSYQEQERVRKMYERLEQEQQETRRKLEADMQNRVASSIATLRSGNLQFKNLGAQSSQPEPPPDRTQLSTSSELAAVSSPVSVTSPRQAKQITFNQNAPLVGAYNVQTSSSAMTQAEFEQHLRRTHAALLRDKMKLAGG